MVKFERIEEKDVLNTGRKKLNNAIAGSEQAVNDSADAKQKSEQALSNSESTQTQLDTLVLEGDSSVEAAQARVDEKGDSHSTLKDRIDDGFIKSEKKQRDMMDAVNYELNSKSRKKQGIVVFTSDDSRVEDLTVGKEIFESTGVPQTLYLISDQINKPGYLSKEQCLELQNSLGWEMASHSKTHPAPFPDITDSQARTEFRDSKLELEAMGFNIQNYSYVGGNYGKRERSLAREYYRSARCSDEGFNNGVNLPPLNTYELKTIWIDPETSPLKQYLAENNETEAYNKMRAYVRSSIDKAHEVEGLLVISTHFINIRTQAMRDFYKEMVQYANSKLVVTTLNKALNAMGNIIDVGDCSDQGRRAVGDTHYVVGVDGFVSGSLGVAKEGRFDDNTPYTLFPLGVTVVPLLEDSSLGAGTLINFKPYAHEPGTNKINFGWQEFLSETNRTPKLRRNISSNSRYTPWFPDNMMFMPGQHDFDLSTEYKDFPAGITMARITSNSPSLHLAPDGRAGTMTMFKQDTGINSSRYSYMEYQLWGVDLTYRKRVIGDNEFGEWFIVNGVHLADQNKFDTTTSPEDFLPGTTYSIITSENSNVDDSPDGRGILKTDKPIMRGSWGYITQGFTPAGSVSKYYRNAESADKWGEFRKITTETID